MSIPITCQSKTPPVTLGPVTFDNSFAKFTYNVGIESDLYVGNLITSCSVSANNGEFNNLDAVNANIQNLTTINLEATNANITNANITNANITNLEVTNITLPPEVIDLDDLNKNISPSLMISMPLSPLQDNTTIFVVNPYDYEMRVTSIAFAKNQYHSPMDIQIQSQDANSSFNGFASITWNKTFNGLTNQLSIADPTDPIWNNDNFIIKPWGRVIVTFTSSETDNLWFSVSLRTERV